MTAQHSGNDGPTQSEHIEHKHYGISPYRNKAGMQVGWAVSLRRRDVSFLRSFSAAKHGGMEGALQAALALRDEIDRTRPPLSKREWCTIRRASNTSGVPGVYRSSGKHGADWRATIEIAGKRRSCKFSVARYGEAEAYRLAVEARKRLLAEAEGVMTRHPEACPWASDEQGPIGPLAIAPLFTARARNPVAPPKACDVAGVTHGVRHKTCLDGAVQTTHYWIATMPLGEGRRQIVRSFSVRQFGDEQAKQLAIAQRQHWEAQRERGEPYTQLRRAGRSGVHGVVRLAGRWQARLTFPDGRSTTRTFSIKKYGSDGALQLAIAARQEHDEQFPQMRLRTPSHSTGMQADDDE